MRLHEAVHMLTTNPRALLEQAHVSIAGAGLTPVSSGLRMVKVSMPEHFQGTKQNTAGVPLPTVSVELFMEPGGIPAPLWRDTNSGIEYMGVRTYYISMKRQEADPGGIPDGTRYALPLNNDGPPVETCVTSQLSGCTFGIGSQVPGGACLVSHIQPLGGAPLDNLALAQQTTNLFGAAPELLVQQGVPGGYADRATILGHRQYGRWYFFIQEVNFAGIVQDVRDL